MFIDKVIRNVYTIGGGITVSAFGISFISSRIKLPKLNYSTSKIFDGEINSIDDIEDLEYTKGCRFYFYDKNLGSKIKIQKARDFEIADTDRTKIVDKVKEWLKNKEKNECTKGRYVYFNDVIPVRSK